MVVLNCFQTIRFPTFNSLLESNLIFQPDLFMGGGGRKIFQESFYGFHVLYLSHNLKSYYITNCSGVGDEKITIEEGEISEKTRVSFYKQETGNLRLNSG